MLPLTFFGARPVSLSLLAGFALNIGLYGLTFLMSLYFQQLRDLSALATGLAFLPMTLQTALVAFLSAQVVQRFGAKTVMPPGSGSWRSAWSSSSRCRPALPSGWWPY